MVRWSRLIALAFVSAAIAPAQFEGPRSRTQAPAYSHEVDYDGRFTFVRLRWRGDGRFRGGWASAWDHDYPRAEQHLAQILRELTYLDIRQDGSRILTLDDPELFQYPIALHVGARLLEPDR